MAARDVDCHILVEPVDRSLNGLQAFPDRGPRLHGRAPAAGARAGKVVVDLRRITDASRQTVSGKVGRLCGRRIGDDRERRLQGVGEVAGMTPCLLCLRFAMARAAG